MIIHLIICKIHSVRNSEILIWVSYSCENKTSHIFDSLSGINYDSFDSIETDLCFGGSENDPIDPDIATLLLIFCENLENCRKTDSFTS